MSATEIRPTPFSIHTKGGEAFPCEPEDTILRAALRAGIAMPYSCNVGSCGNCRFELLAGAVEHLRADAPAWSERDLKRNRYLGCQAAPRSDCTIKFRAGPAATAAPRPAMRGGEILSTTPITHDIMEFAIRVEGDDRFLPGQYALLSVPDVEGGRAYSMCNLPGDGVWRFQIKRVREGRATAHLFDVAGIGGAVTLDGPYGTAHLDPTCPRDVVLIAGGSGLSPMVSIARGADAAGMLCDRRLYFFYGGRTEADLFDSTVLGPVAQQIDFTAALSDPDSIWSGAAGYLHEVVGAALGDRLKTCELYFAGPAVMSVAVQRMAHEHGVPMDQLHFDEFY